jgi:hypothetical protein
MEYTFVTKTAGIVVTIVKGGVANPNGFPCCHFWFHLVEFRASRA